MSITAETAKQHENDPAVLCCRAEAGITIEPANLEDPAIFDELVDSGLLSLDGCLKIKAGAWRKADQDKRLLMSAYTRQCGGIQGRQRRGRSAAGGDSPGDAGSTGSGGSCQRAGSSYGHQER